MIHFDRQDPGYAKGHIFHNVPMLKFHVWTLSGQIMDSRASYAPIKVMPNLPPTRHRRGLDHFYVAIPCPPGIFRGLMTLS